MSFPLHKIRIKNIPMAFLKPQILFLILIGIVLVFNSISLGKELRKMKKNRETHPYIFVGRIFSGLKDILKDVEYMGYYTDKSMDDRKDAMQFSQAQYTLVPIILDLNNTQYKYILFDCSKEEIAFEKIKEIKAVPVRMNQFGIILARNLNPRASP